MKRVLRTLTASTALLLAFILTACSSSSNSPMASTSAASSSAAYAEAGDYEMAEQAAASAAAAPGESGAGSNTAMPASIDPSRKLIRNVRLEIETKEYDVLTKTVMEQLTLAGGYIETSRMVGGAYVSEYDDYYAPANGRYASIVARVPQDKVDGFIASLGKHGTIRDRQESVRDVTLEYVDVESHKKSLAIEYERLLSLLEKADKLEAIVELERRLSEVRYQIESYESQLRAFDNQVNYSTIEISITEVEHITPAKVEQKTVGQRMAAGLSDTMYGLKTGAENFLVWFVVNLPFLVIWAAILAGLGLILRLVLKKQNPDKASVPKKKKRGGNTLNGLPQQEAVQPAPPEENTK